MAFAATTTATTNLSELHLKTCSPSSLSLTSPHSSSSSSTLFFFRSKPPFRTLTLTPFSSLRTSQQHTKQNNRSSSTTKPNTNTSTSTSNPSAPWLAKTPPPNNSSKRVTESHTNDPLHDTTENRYFDGDKGQNAVERIVLRLRNLGLASDDDDEEEEEEEGKEEVSIGGVGDDFPVTGEERLGELLRREWIRPDVIVREDDGVGDDEMVFLPWQREVEEREMGAAKEGGEKGMRDKRRVKAPTLAELTLEDEVLRRLRREGMRTRERVNVPKAGLTKEVMEKIHERWRKEELVRLKFHEDLARDMRTAHEIVERRTGGLVTWRAGSVMMVYRGANYQGPSSGVQHNAKEGDAFFVPDVSSRTKDSDAASSSEKSEPIVWNRVQPENMTEEEAEYNALLDSLGPRFIEWWGTGILPVDADSLPPTVPGYKTPFRLLPTGMRSRLTNAEMTNLRKLAKTLPCHFALGRNRRHQGLACAILKLWEKSLIAKIAVKRGIQNTNNELMAEEIKTLTGGTLLLRNKYYIVIYRGKDFVPTAVATVLAERQELTKQVQDVEDKFRSGVLDATPSGKDESATPQAGSLAEFYEAQARWGRDISTEERERMMEEAAKSKQVRLVRHIEHKLATAEAKKLRAERLLAKIEASMVPAGPDYDQETITDEERVVFRRIGLRMKAYLPLGIRGVFDGVVENMHLHWKHRELVKLISKQKTLAFVEDTARLLEFESGGILVAIERVPKGFALIYYRGKNYKRPIILRPKNLLTKQKALKRSVAMQRHEALSQHITELEKTIEQMKTELGMPQDLEDEDMPNIEDHNQIDNSSEFSQSEDENFDGLDDYDDNEHEDDDSDEEQDIDWEDEDDSEFSKLENGEHP
ncbi:hypothetical protein Ahy_A05g023023 isoform B [Arachis hypogaea]|uniref:CRM domain-containing protein n=1 Tax=Arachis hypogaea TaxID=3818 RepID=A0A445D259_ARAHY|nr:hypothetical protein Ahy_A05g023023 isoform A [Arachis hypogaea]RYR57299.1 hypothetical protein Ahy_A05g023023 isoform B [Arachis hypogaea]